MKWAVLVLTLSQKNSTAFWFNCFHIVLVFYIMIYQYMNLFTCPFERKIGKLKLNGVFSGFIYLNELPWIFIIIIYSSCWCTTSEIVCQSWRPGSMCPLPSSSPCWIPLESQWRTRSVLLWYSSLTFTDYYR